MKKIFKKKKNDIADWMKKDEEALMKSNPNEKHLESLPFLSKYMAMYIRELFLNKVIFIPGQFITKAGGGYDFKFGIKENCEELDVFYSVMQEKSPNEIARIMTDRISKERDYFWSTVTLDIQRFVQQKLKEEKTK